MTSVRETAEAPVEQKPLAGLLWGVLCGAGGGVVAALGLSALMVVGYLLFVDTTESAFEVVLEVGELYLTLGGVFGTFFGALAGGFAGLVLGTNRYESIAPQTGAVIAAFGPMAYLSTLLFRPQGEPFDLLAVLAVVLWTAMMAAIGFGAGMVFRSRLADDNR